jgi:lipoprotein LprG
MPGVGGDNGPSDGEPSGIPQIFLADDFAHFFDDSGEHAARLTPRVRSDDDTPKVQLSSHFCTFTRARPPHPGELTHYDAVMPTRLLAIFAALVTAIALLAGCSSSEDNSNLPDAATLLKQSAETTKSQTSVHLLLTVQGEIAALPIETLEGNLTTSPAVAAEGKANILVLGQRLEGVSFVVIDGKLYGAITAGTFQDFGPAADIYDVSAILSPEKGLANVVSNFSDAKADGRETINGVKTVRVTGNVSADAVNKIANLGVTAPVPGTAWIAEEGNHELMQAKLEPTPGNSVTMTMSDWGKPVTVNKPAV